MPTLEYTLSDGQKIRQGRPFRIEGVASFPRNWLANATPEDLQRFEITVEEIPDPEPEVREPTAVDVDGELARRKDELFSVEQRERGYRAALEALSESRPVPQVIKNDWAQLKALENKAEALKGLETIPADFRDNKHWT